MSDAEQFCWQCGKRVGSGQKAVLATSVSMSSSVPTVLLHAMCLEHPEIVLVPCPPCLRALLNGTDAEPHDCEEQPLLAIDGDVVVIPSEGGYQASNPPVESDALKAARATARAIVAKERARRAAPGPREGS